MNSKECLERLLKIAYVEPGPTKEKFITYARETEHNKKCSDLYNTIKQDLDRLEKLEKENQELRKAIKQWNINSGNLLKENTKLKKALDKACERLEYYTGNCPCGEELIEDLDCENCVNNCKECWNKYFMKEVL